MTRPSNHDQSGNVRQMFDHHADVYQQRFMDVTRYGETLQHFCALLPKGPARVLDVGCGPGNLSRFLMDMRPELQITGTDLAPRMIDLARANVPGGRFLVGDARYLADLGPPFDGVLLGFILPYLDKAETRDLLSRVADLLRPSGTVYLSTMEGGEELSGLKGASTGEGPSLYLQYYSAEELIEGLTVCGFALHDERRSTYQDHHGDQVTDLMLVARKAG